MPREGMLIQLDGSFHRWLGEDHPYFSIDTKSYDIRGWWTCLHRRWSRTGPLEKSWTFEAAKIDFRRSKPRGH